MAAAVMLVQHCTASFTVYTSLALVACWQLEHHLRFQMSSISHIISSNAMQHAQQDGSQQAAARRNTYGGAFPARMALDRQILSR